MEFRSARHTDNLEAMVDFYNSVLVLETLFSFEDHNGYCGVMLGKTDHSWHLEFTSSNTSTHHKFDREDLLVFYPTSQDEYDGILERIDESNIERVVPRNPYWIENGTMIQDPDGHGIIVSGLKVSKLKNGPDPK